MYAAQNWPVNPVAPQRMTSRCLSAIVDVVGEVG